MTASSDSFCFFRLGGEIFCRLGLELFFDRLGRFGLDPFFDRFFDLFGFRAFDWLFLFLVELLRAGGMVSSLRASVSCV